MPASRPKSETAHRPWNSHGEILLYQSGWILLYWFLGLEMGRASLGEPAETVGTKEFLLCGLSLPAR